MYNMGSSITLMQMKIWKLVHSGITIMYDVEEIVVPKIRLVYM
jgi:hypothetical protein